MTTTDNGVASEARIDALLAAMTLEEKVALMGGASMWLTVPVERLGIPAIKVSDGPNGARGGGSFAGGSVTSACFPVGISLASTWNTDLVTQIGDALGEETRSKGACMLLGPTVNIHRSPLNGRNFECYSEDPYLSARMAVAYINGLQSKGVGATVKHYVCNDSEFERNTINSEVDERTLREIYLPPFLSAVQEAHSWGVMASYNKVNGVYAGENRTTLIDILKDEWGFDGIVMSDWFGTKSVIDSANNGLDLEMPGPTRWRGEKLLAALQKGEVNSEAVDESARRMLRLMMRVGAFEHPEIPAEQTRDVPEHRALIRTAAAEGIVLLKHTGDVLPLDPDKHLTIAIIGPNAKTAQIMGGGSAQVNAHYMISPYAGIVEAVGDQMELRYAIGCTNHKTLPRLAPELVMPDAGAEEQGFTVAYYNNNDLHGEPVYQEITRSSEQAWLGEVAPGVQPGNFSARFSAIFTPQESGTHNVSLSSAGLSRCFIDGQEIIDNWTHQTRGGSYFGTGSTEVVVQVDLQARQPYELRMEYSNQGATLLSAVRLGYLPPVAGDSIGEAAKLAADADVAVVFVGLNGDWESEGFDRPDMELPGQQAELIERVAAANSRTVVVLQSGSPIVMPWLDKVAAVFQAWYPGQECGNAIADVLFGRVNPSGKLPQTFPVRLEDNPAFINYPGENGRVRYGEGFFVGYRYYEQKQVAPLFPFGFGLSYTSFDYANLHLSSDTITPNEQLVATIDITNTGERAGQEVVQAYIRDQAARLTRPQKELKGFAKVSLQPGETKTVTLTFDRTALAFWDDAKHAWVAEKGAFDLLVGASSQDIRAQATFKLTDTVSFGGPAQQQRALNVNSTLRELMEDDNARAVLERHIPALVGEGSGGMLAGMPLAQIAGFAPEQISDETLQAIDAELMQEVA